ncbi:MAG: hypothetical protein LBH43_07105 [Treponema sp.]|nr:hypothetical protein [Treponema sp.]
MNRGLILEQAICDLIDEYIQTIKLEKTYSKNFTPHVTLQHPFSQVFLDKGVNAADHFPAVIISTYDDEKPPEMDGLPPQTQGTALDAVGLTKGDIDIILSAREENGKPVPGIPIAANPELIEELRKILKKQDQVFGYSVRTYRQDSISIEIWAENVQVKNQIYEDVRLFVLGNLRNVLIDRYESYDLKIDDESIHGQRSSAYNIDFGVILSGASIRFKVNYAVEQILINTEFKELHREIILKEDNHVQI